MIRVEETKGKKLPKRWGNSAIYIPPLHAILTTGGFDLQCNYCDIKLLFINNYKWYDISITEDDDNIFEVRAFHTTTSRFIYDENKNVKAFEVYIFGGQYCQGGPYIYHNDLFRFTFYPQNKQQKKNGEVIYERIKIDQDEKLMPHPRSKCHSFIEGNNLYIYGGAYETSTLNDLYAFNLSDQTWKKIQYKDEDVKNDNIPKIHRLVPQNFRVSAVPNYAYYNRQSQELIVIQYNYNNNNNDDDDNNNNKCLQLYRYKLKYNKWIKFDCESNSNKDMDIKSSIIQSALIRHGCLLLHIGGSGGNSHGEFFNEKNVKKIIRGPLRMIEFIGLKIYSGITWDSERIIWIGFKKNEKSNQCGFGKLPIDIIHYILAYLE